CVVFGAGGAGRAVVAALAAAGAAEVAVVARTPDAAERAAALGAGAGRRGATADVEDADLVVDATPVGMSGTSTAGTPPVVDPALLRPGCVVADLVYDPRITPLLAGAAAGGATTLGGLGMLVHQAAAQLRLWTGLAAPVDTMWAAAESAIGRPGPSAHG
ncbi:MAG: shikimate dehydrogenase, partial [Acidimicrobiales bacterium]